MGESTTYRHLNTLKLVIAIVGALASLILIVLIARFAIFTTDGNFLSAARCFLICIGVEMLERSLEWLGGSKKR